MDAVLRQIGREDIVKNCMRDIRPVLELDEREKVSSFALSGDLFPSIPSPYTLDSKPIAQPQFNARLRLSFNIFVLFQGTGEWGFDGKRNQFNCISLNRFGLGIHLKGWRCSINHSFNNSGSIHSKLIGLPYTSIHPPCIHPLILFVTILSLTKIIASFFG